MAITLKDYEDKSRHFILQEPQGDWAVVKGESPEPTWGYATLVPQRLGFAKPVLVAVFTDRKTVLLRVGDQLFDLRDSRTQFNHRWSGILRSTFTVLANGKQAARVVYNPLSIGGDSWDSGNVFHYLVEGFSDKGSLDRSVFIWTAAGEGRKLADPAFLAEMESKFGSQVSKPARSGWRGMMCLASYWLLFVILPAALVLWFIPTGKRLGFALPIGLVLILVGENGFRGWKQLWRVG